MGNQVFFMQRILVLVVSSIIACEANYDIYNSLNRSSFPVGFTFGAASSAYQYEGAANEGGKGPSIWDTFTHQYPGKIADGSNGDVADDSYHLYNIDVGILKNMGMDAYRLSISWSRVLPYGTKAGGRNEEGIQHYHNVINALLEQGIKPFVTLYHWDLPQALENAYLGFLSPQIVADYVDFVDLCFEEYGDRVKHWITLNEPSMFSSGGYANGLLAPGRCSPWLPNNCTGGDSAVEPYLVTHYQLLAHAAAVKLYRDKYQAHQKGEIGITLVCDWKVPFTQAKQDRDATQRAIDFQLGWFMDPLVNGDYPHIMRLLVGYRLPKFSEQESDMLKGSFDFIGINYYTTAYVADGSKPNPIQVSYATDAQVKTLTERNGQLIGPQAGSTWLYIYPKGIWDLLIYMKNKYNNPTIYITENGVDEISNATMPLEEALLDPIRIEYYYSHLCFVKLAIEDGVNVKGYFAWTLLDDFEWNSGYTIRFGINFVDYKDGLKRYPKLSAGWFTKFLE